MKSFTYKQIIEDYKRLYGRPVIQPCWIADVKRSLGIPMKQSKNRTDRFPVKPCPRGIVRARLTELIRKSTFKH
jgi:hypothetical protein